MHVRIPENLWRHCPKCGRFAAFLDIHIEEKITIWECVICDIHWGVPWETEVRTKVI